MKNKLLPDCRLCALLLVLGCTFFLPQRAVAQLSVDYAQTQLGSPPLNKYSVIRSVANGTMAVASMNHSSHATVYLIDPTSTMTICHADLEDNLFIYDMRVINSTVYFCGSSRGNGCIGYFDYNDLLASVPLNIQLKEIALSHVGYGVLYRMAAYPNGSEEKVVAVGEIEYDHNDSFPPDFPDCWDSSGIYHTCLRRLVVEANFPSFSMYYLCSESAKQYDYMQEVVEVDNYVAIVGCYNPKNGISIHRCDKSAVLATYQNDWYYYPVTPNECASKIKGCRMKEDKLAIVSMAPDTYYGGATLLASVMRVFDLNTMDNINAQLVVTGLKDEPKDILYMHGPDSLILLNPIRGTTFNCFITLDPNSIGGYAARCWYNPALNYNSLDRATATHYIASGGEFWCIKDATTLSNAGTCYRNETIAVKPIVLAPKIKGTCLSFNILMGTARTVPPPNINTEPLTPTCVTFY